MAKFLNFRVWAFRLWVKTIEYWASASALDTEMDAVLGGVIVNANSSVCPG